ncbi:class I SAM-dependent methyltransferase [Tropicimonas sp. IMCC6043]|uniref:class I SAM-dependent methyltransferase n=1 Tax=Tropicimonas sp. IMCC6043 TaxID=2510645 RepID=UPI00101DEFAC|nr:class I SAM-dependent methyltransferase [Tropicimonas sp. IMCC6043]RYH07913.1 class I SAM-dependent methyltransferase [Tropicimonas sp. IMCC6043]
MFDPQSSLMGGVLPGDGTVDFYLRVATIVDARTVLLDLGAGRGEWFEDDDVPLRRNLRLMKGRAVEVIGVDVDPAVLENRSVDRAAVITDGVIPVPDGAVDVIVCDYVLEHVDDVAGFAAEIDRVLKPGGWFCARTPSKWHYIAMAGRIMSNGLASRLIRRSQPDRKQEDVFPTVYKLNRLRDVAAAFPSYESRSFVFRTRPSYFFGNRALFWAFDFLHRVMPAAFSGNLFVFLKKSGSG